MGAEVGARPEGVAARLAGEGPLVGVRPNVRVQVVLVGERLPALGAGEGPLARVDAPVALQLAGHGEGLAAHLATVHAGMQAQVQRQVPADGERLPARAARVRPLRRVVRHV